MKKLIFMLFVTTIIITSLACDDQVNPKTDFRELYALNCVIKGDTSLQVATISRAYDVNGFDPLSNTADPFIKGAKIKLTYHGTGEVFFFRDTTLIRTDNSRYTSPMSYYYIKNFRPTYESPVSIEAVLPNGKVLSAKSTVLFISRFAIENRSYTIPSTTTGKYLGFSWTAATPSVKDEKIYYVPELIIKYAKIQGGTPIELQKKVPLYYISGENGEFPLYPSIQSNITSVNFDTLTIRRSLEEISAGDANKQNYIIRNAVFRLIITDKNLAVYYAAQKTFLDEFSVRVTQPEFTNINGGLGIFGTLNSTYINVPIKPEYIVKYGYKAF
ncbi:MAG: hypothetical protein CVV24_01880 [Ignavibacteriae bacterium HGW-Ignavibacteriae-3]|nr:MAG: hypothetical protein CVV24_01880 [Ignavibacteriae bacterium HGW-Ignavibacteriae-3]